MVTTPSESKEALMEDRTIDRRTAHTNPCDPVLYLRGLTQLIQQQRLDYILARTSRQRRRQRRLTALSVVWLVVAMSLFATDSIPSAWRRLHPSADRPEPHESAFTKARQRLGVAPLRELFRDSAAPMAAPGTPGAFYRSW